MKRVRRKGDDLVHFLDTYKGKSRFVLEFIKRALFVEMRAAFGERTKRKRKQDYRAPFSAMQEIHCQEITIVSRQNVRYKRCEL